MLGVPQEARSGDFWFKGFRRARLAAKKRAVRKVAKKKATKKRAVRKVAKKKATKRRVVRRSRR